MVVDSLRRRCWTAPTVENLVTQADTMYHFVELFNEYESNIDKHLCMEFFICQMQINKRMCDMIDKLIEYELSREAQKIILRGKHDRQEQLCRLTDNIRTYMKDQDKALHKDVHEIKKIIRKTMLVNKCYIKVWIREDYHSTFEYELEDERHKYYFIKILGYTEEQLTTPD